jgi:hypothetical protein
MHTTYEHFLRIAYPPGEIPDVPICLDNFWCELNTEPAGG